MSLKLKKNGVRLAQRIGSQNLRAACPKGKLKSVFFFAPVDNIISFCVVNMWVERVETHFLTNTFQNWSD